VIDDAFDLLKLNRRTVTSIVRTACSLSVAGGGFSHRSSASRIAGAIGTYLRVIRQS
jgi:hypothetical protein